MDIVYLVLLLGVFLASFGLVLELNLALDLLH
jgi:hypothetical protein